MRQDDFDRQVAESGVSSSLLATTCRLQPGDLAGVDEFHLGGRMATDALLANIELTADSRVLDVGCGIGGAARTIAKVAGCSVTGVDLTPEFSATAGELSAQVGMAN